MLRACRGNLMFIYAFSGALYFSIYPRIKCPSNKVFPPEGQNFCPQIKQLFLRKCRRRHLGWVFNYEAPIISISEIVSVRFIVDIKTGWRRVLIQVAGIWNEFWFSVCGLVSVILYVGLILVGSLSMAAPWPRSQNCKATPSSPPRQVGLPSCNRQAASVEGGLLCWPR